MLKFDDEALFSSYYDLLEKRLREYEFDNNCDIDLYSQDDFDNSAAQFPTVVFDLFGHSTNTSATDFVAIDYVTPFSVQIDVFTSGLNKGKNGRNLANDIIQFFQEIQPVGEHFTRGLSVVSKQRTPNLNNDICRWTVMLSGKCDNLNKLILPR